MRQSGMRIFYGYKRRPDDAPDGCEQVWLDDAKTERQERFDMMLGLREGDTVVVLSRSDLGRGAEVKALEAAIEGKGAALVVDAPEVLPKPVGRPARFAPTPEADAKIKALYHGYNVMSYVLRRASELAGMEVKAHHLKRRYGNRWDNDKESSDAP